MRRNEALRPLAGHAVLILLIQLALLLIVARLGAELSRRAGLPVVVGELAAGLILGPSVFGHLAPGAFLHIFPASAEQYHLLEVVGTLGMILLLLLTGLETDLKFAVRYCEVTESALTLAVLGERDRLPAGDSLTGEHPITGTPEAARAAQLGRISPVFRASAIVPQVLHLSPQRFFKTVLEKTQGKPGDDGHDLMVIGAENRAIRRRLFFGHDNERLIRETAASVAILIPHLGHLTIGPT